MSNQDHGPRILAFGIALAVVGLIFASVYARAATFNERFTTEAPTRGEWTIQLLLIIDGKVARSIVYNDETYPTGDACRDAVLADTPLQSSMQTAANAAVEGFGETAKPAIACTMHLD
jgi:hypothetical protein